MHQQALWQLLAAWQRCASLLGLCLHRHRRTQSCVLTLNTFLTAQLAPWKGPCSVLCLRAAALGLLPSSAASMLLSASAHSLLLLLPMLGTISSAVNPEPLQLRCLSGSACVVTSACHSWHVSRSIYWSFL